HPGQPTVDAIEGAEVDRIKTIDDAALADPAGDGNGLFLDRRQHRLERDIGQFSQAARKSIDPAIRIRPAAPEHDRVVSNGHGAVAWVRIVADRTNLDGDLVAELLVGADMAERGIATEHLTVPRIHHAAAGGVAKLKSDRIKSTEQGACPPAFQDLM